MDKFKEQTSDSFDFRFTDGEKSVKVGISVFGLGDEKKEQLFAVTRGYKENIRLILTEE